MILNELLNAAEKMRNSGYVSSPWNAFYCMCLAIAQIGTRIEKIERCLDLQMDDAIITKGPDEMEKNWVSIKECCSDVIYNGKMILNPGSICHYIHNTPEYFGDCAKLVFTKGKKKGRYIVIKDKFLEKLAQYPKQYEEQRNILQKYLQDKKKKEII